MNGERPAGQVSFLALACGHDGDAPTGILPGNAGRAGYDLAQAAAKPRRRLKGANQLPLVIEGVTFTVGVAVRYTENHAA